MINQIINRLGELTEIAAINRTVNPNYAGNSIWPAVRISYGYSADGRSPQSSQQDVLDLEITSAATDGAAGAVDIDANLALDNLIYEKLNGWRQPTQTAQQSEDPWWRVSGGSVSRDSGLCRCVVRYRRAVTLAACALS